MATTATDPARPAAAAWLSPEALRALAPLVRLVSSIWSVESVQRIALATDGGQIDLWVLMREEIEEDEDQISLLERDYLNEVGPIPFSLHVYPLSEIDESMLPPAETVLER